MRMKLHVSLVVACSIALLAQDFKARQQHVTAAVAALNADDAKTGKDCVQAKNQYEGNICTAQVADDADQNFAVFYENLKAIIGDDAQKKLQDSQDAWLDYRKKACDAVLDFYKSGTIRNSEYSRCQTRLTRQRMRDLDFLYDSPLHH